jgi:hypothetical protein
MTDIFEVLGPLFRKLTETCIAHQIAETGSATLLVESDKYMARYRFTLEPVATDNVLAKIWFSVVLKSLAAMRVNKAARYSADLLYRRWRY